MGSSDGIWRMTSPAFFFFNVGIVFETGVVVGIVRYFSFFNTMVFVIYLSVLNPEKIDSGDFSLFRTALAAAVMKPPCLLGLVYLYFLADSLLLSEIDELSYGF